MEELTYNAKEICEEFNIKMNVLNYLEKALGLDIERDTFNTRIYSEENKNIIKRAVRYKNQGMSYKEIKSKLVERGLLEEELAITKVEEDQSILFRVENINESMELIQKFLKTTIQDTIKEELKGRDEKIISELNGIKDKLNNDSHYKELDNKMKDMLENQQRMFKQQEEANQKKSLFQKIFNR